MKYGVIDIGTNTIRSVVYDSKLSVIDQTVAESTILKHTKDGYLTEAGIGELCSSLQAVINFFKDNSAENISAFATSAMRDVQNYSAVKDAVHKACKINLELLSENEEALCDFESVKLQTESNATGAAADLGGGSCQLLLYKNGNLTYHCSKKLGVKRMFNSFGELNAAKESEVREFVNKSFNDAPFFTAETLFMMGGTSKKIKKLIKTIIGSDEITPKTLALCLKLYREKNPEYIKRSATEINKIPYGIIIMEELCRLCGSKKAAVLSGGVREGYVLRHIKTGKDEPAQKNK